MSRISKNPVALLGGVECTLSNSIVTIKGSLGVLDQKLTANIDVSLVGNTLNVSTKDKSRHAHAMSGTIRSLLANMVVGVHKGFEKKLNLVGVGYRAQLKDGHLVLDLGFSHNINFAVPQDIKIEVPKPTEIIVKGIDKQRVGQVAAEIRAFRKPEPYKGKGVRYSDETITLKETKKK